MRVFPFVSAVAVLVSAMWAGGGAIAQTPPTPFPDVPPWHWAYQAVLQAQQAGVVIGYPAAPAELVQNSITQVYGSFAHARATGAQTWAERFTYDRPATWPASLERSPLVAFSIEGLQSRVSGDTATAAFAARITTARATGGEVHAVTPMRISLRLIDGDWKIDYATLAQNAPLFR